MGRDPSFELTKVHIFHDTKCPIFLICSSHRDHYIPLLASTTYFPFRDKFSHCFWVITSYSGEGFSFGLKLQVLKKMFMLDLVSFLIQICHQGQHLDINKISIPL